MFDALTAQTQLKRMLIKENFMWYLGLTIQSWLFNLLILYLLIFIDNVFINI